ncbi:MAG: hypothetical protein ABI832_14485, partial [bacterium]
SPCRRSAMPVVPRTLSAVSWGTITLCLLPWATMADPLAVIDNEGFGATMTAFTMDLPVGWSGTGKVIWNKPCSGNDLYEVSLTATSADGQSGIRMKPGHQVQWVDTSVDGSVDPYIAQLAVAQAEALKNEMRTRFRGSNCHFGKLAGTEAQVTQQLLQVLILPDLPAGARVTGMAPNSPTLALYKSTAAPGMAGFFSRYDAQIIDLAYDGPTGPMVERLFLTWSQYGTDPATPALPGFPKSEFQTLILDTITFVYAPAGRAGDIEVAVAAVKSTRVDPAWQEELRKVQARIAEQQQKAQKDRSDAFDRQNKAFLDTIMQ